MTTRWDKLRRMLAGLGLVCALFVCGTCGLLGVQLSLLPGTPITVDVGKYKLGLVKMPPQPGGARPGGTRYSGTTCRYIPRQYLEIGDFGAFLFECAP